MKINKLTKKTNEVAKYYSSMHECPRCKNTLNYHSTVGGEEGYNYFDVYCTNKSCKFNIAVTLHFGLVFDYKNRWEYDNKNHSLNGFNDNCDQPLIKMKLS